MITDLKTERVEWKDLQLPEILYKYRCWTSNEYHKRSLSHSEIFLSSPRHFNDPFDCRIPIAYHLLESDHEMRKTYFPKVVKSNFPYFNDKQIEEEVERLENEKFYSDFRRMQAYDKSYFEDLYDRWGVFSMTTKPLNSLMWAHYANDHKGICLGFDSKILFSDSNKFGGGGKINYMKKFPHIRPDAEYMEQSIFQIYSKSDEWIYEDEYRVDKFEGANTTIEYNGDALKEIYLGFRMNKDEMNEAFLFARKLNKKVEAYVIFPEEYSFNLNFDKFKP